MIRAAFHLLLIGAAGLAASQAPYAGWKQDAPWRTMAARRIDQIRKADLKVIVTDGKGRPMRGAQVSVRMKRHAFGFGTAVAARTLLGAGEDNGRYRRALLELFNKAVLENDLKWPQWEADSQPARDALKWLRENGFRDVRGHCLVWPGWKWMPKDAAALWDQPEALRDRIRRHITAEVSAVRGEIAEWDVFNEPYTNHDAQDILGSAEMAEWFRLARQADSAPRLFVNDFNILSAGGQDTAHQNHYFNTIRTLLDAGAPLDGIGMQGHFNARLTAPARVLEVLDRFAVFHKPIQVTEFDVNIGDEKLQADFTRDFLTATFSHPSVSGFLMWGFWEGRHWKPKGAMIRKDWSLKPNAVVWKDLVFNQWWTRAAVRTGKDGSCTVRGFLGDYEIEAKAKGGTKTAAVALPAGGETFRLVLE